jgi:hypothetical protein
MFILENKDIFCSTLSVFEENGRTVGKGTQTDQYGDIKDDGLVKSPSSGRGRLSPGLGLGWNHLNSLQMAGEGQPSSAE